MNSLFNIVLTVHITAGICAFVVAPIAMISRKGGRSHRNWGKIFFWSMMIICLTAFIMAPMKNNLFLVLVGVFSFYLAFSGYRSLYRKKLYKTGKVAFIDWLVVIITSLFGLYLLFIGIRATPQGLAFVAIVFGALASWLGINDIYSFLKPKNDKNQWLYGHMTGMIASYIAAVSAFSVVNLDFEWMPAFILWIWPSIIGVPLLIYWLSLYRKKFEKGKKISDVAEIQIQPEEN